MASNKQKKQQSQAQPKSQPAAAAVVKKEKHSKKSQSSKQTTATKKSCSKCWYWTLGIIVLLIAIVVAIRYDTNKNGNGNFEKSAFGTFLKDTGALPYVLIATTNTLHYSARGYQWAEVNLPVYYTKTKEISTPYFNFSKDVGINIWNGLKQLRANFCQIVKDKYVVACKYIDQYSPGLPKKIENISITSWDILSSTAIKVYSGSVEFFKTNVFVGKLSPENLSKALNETQNCAAEYYSWFHKKVDDYANIKSS
jgi:hypothetical protein